MAQNICQCFSVGVNGNKWLNVLWAHKVSTFVALDGQSCSNNYFINSLRTVQRKVNIIKSKMGLKRASADQKSVKCKLKVQSNLSNTDTEGTEQSVSIREVTMMTSFLIPHWWPIMLFAEWTMEQSELRLSFLIVNCCSHIEQHYMQNTVGIDLRGSVL